MPRIHTTPDGIRYVLHHERPEHVFSGTAEPDPYVVPPKGGRTTVVILGMNDAPLVTGEAICHPKLDNFSYKRGHQIALGRALKAYREIQASAVF